MKGSIQEAQEVEFGNELALGLVGPTQAGLTTQVRKNEISVEASTTNIRSPGDSPKEFKGTPFGAENDLETRG